MDDWIRNHPLTPEYEEIGGQLTAFDVGEAVDLGMFPSINEQLSQDQLEPEISNATEQPAPFDFDQEIRLHESFHYDQWSRNQGWQLLCAIAHGR